MFGIVDEQLADIPPLGSVIIEDVVEELVGDIASKPGREEVRPAGRPAEGNRTSSRASSRRLSPTIVQIVGTRITHHHFVVQVIKL